jgi:hypothetical protein
MGRVFSMMERVLAAVVTCLLAVAQKWTTFLGLLFQLSAVMSQYFHFHKLP